MSNNNKDLLTIADLKPAPGSNKKKIRKGRGASSRKGRSSGRGRGGSGHRSGNSHLPGFEGGQMPFIRRIPKRGFNNTKFERKVEIVNIWQLQEKFKSGEKVSPEKLKQKGLVKGKHTVKILGKGEIKKKLKVSNCELSKGAKEKITEAGGEISQ
ncbi:MAG: 50S ribosomal protein L15 [Elusimicrobiota bacterium]